MVIKATYKGARMSPRKIRSVAHLMSGLPVVDARHQLLVSGGKAAGIILRVLQSAVSNATHNYELDENSLVVQRVFVDESIKMKRHIPVWRGMAHPIIRRTSLVTVAVEGKRKARKKRIFRRKSEIKDITPQEYESSREERREEEGERSIEKKEITEGVQPVEKMPPAKDVQVYQKKKMLQQGGDVKKTYRRKSI